MLKKIKKKLVTLFYKISNKYQIKGTINPLKQDLDIYFSEEFANVLETWGENHVWIEIQLLLANCSGKVLDIACGTGIVIKKLEINPNIQVFGFDISNLLIERAIMKGIDKDKIKLMDATKTDYPNLSFDYSYSIGSLEHFTESGIIDFIAETSRYTKTGSFHMIPVSKSGKNEGWIKTAQSFYNNSELWWLEKFKESYKNVIMVNSGWNDLISNGRWFLCYK